jgi:hypothetical protein
MYKKFIEIWLFCATIFAFPQLVDASIRINEVAWMGTSASQYEEWIELYNTGETVSLSGYKIYKASGSTLLISLSGTIDAGGYFLICRTTPSVTSPLSGTCNLNGAFGGSGLSNTSEGLVIKDGAGSTIDSINATSGWPAGDAGSKNTMQWNGSSWVTAVATPGTANVSLGGSSDENNDEEDDTSQNQQNDEDEDDQENTSFSETSKPKVYSTRILKLEYDKTVITKNETYFRARALDFDRSDILKGYYYWNMGDGTVYEFALGYKKTNSGFKHTYDYPGTYNVTVKYFDTFLPEVPPALEENFSVEVVSTGVVVSKVHTDGGVEIKNSSPVTVDLSSWQIIDSSGKSFIIPTGTKISPGKNIVFSTKITKINPFNGVSLLTSANSVVSQYPLAPTKIFVPLARSKVSSSKEEVLGVATSTDPIDEKQKPKESNSSIIWVLAFIVLILVAVVGLLLLKKEEAKEEEYELIED